MNKIPKSAYDRVGGMYYFARMLDKIRLHARGELRSDFHENLGTGGFHKKFKWVCGKTPPLRIGQGGGMGNTVVSEGEWIRRIENGNQHHRAAA